MPKDWNRHAIVMSYIDGHTLCDVQSMENPSEAFKQCVDMLERLA